MVLLDGSFDGSNDGKLEDLLHKKLLRFTDIKVIGFDQGIKLVSNGSKCLSL